MSSNKVNDKAKRRRDSYQIPPPTYFPSFCADVPALKNEKKARNCHTDKQMELTDTDNSPRKQ